MEGPANPTIGMYRGLLVFRPRTPPSEGEFQRLEQVLGASLPAAFRDFASAVAGLALPYSVFLAGRPYEFSFEPLTVVVADLSALWRDAWFRDQLPEVMLPIARTGGADDMLLLDLTPGSYGRVRAWISARPFRPWGPHSDLLHDVAPDLNAYLDGLVLLDNDLDDKHRQNPAVRRWLADRASPERLLLDGVDWGPVWRQ